MIDRRGFFGRFFGMAAAPALIPETQEVKANVPEPGFSGYSGMISSGAVFLGGHSHRFRCNVTSGSIGNWEEIP